MGPWDANIVGDTSPWPSDPGLGGEPEGAGAGCSPSLAQVCAIFTGASPWPHSPLRGPIQHIEGSPDPQVLSYPPSALLPLPFLPRLSSMPFRGPGRAPFLFWKALALSCS